jgi:hypothetical protein
MPATDAGVRHAAAGGTGARQIQPGVAVSAESVEAPLMTVLPAKVLLAPAKGASMAMPFLAAADTIGVCRKAVRFSEGKEASPLSMTSVNMPAATKEKPTASVMSAGATTAATTGQSGKQGKQPQHRKSHHSCNVVDN